MEPYDQAVEQDPTIEDTSLVITMDGVEFIAPTWTIHHQDNGVRIFYYSEGMKIGSTFIPWYNVQFIKQGERA